jgi:hypothetical protein
MSMPFYNPGPYEDFVGKLSSVNVKPSPFVWDRISTKLDDVYNKQRKVAFWKVSAAAASVLLVLSFGISYLIINNNFVGSSAPYYSIINEIPKNSSISSPVENSSFIPPLDLTQNFDLTEESTKFLDQDEDFIIEEKEIKVFVPEFITPIEVKTLSVQNVASTIISHSRDKVLVREMPNNPVNSTETLTTQLSNTVKANNDFHNSKKGKWSMMVFVNPSFSYHTTAALNYSLNPSEKGAWVLGADLLLKRDLNSYFSLYTGLMFNPTGQNIKDLILLKNVGTSRNMRYIFANTSYGQVTLENARIGISNFSNLGSAPDDLIKSSSLNSAELRQRFYYMEVPLIFSSRVKRKNLDVEIKLGCSAGLLTSNRFEIISRLGTFEGQNDDIRKYSASALGAVSFSVPINRNINFTVEPNIRLSLLTLSNTYTSTYPFNASIRFGVAYRL